MKSGLLRDGLLVLAGVAGGCAIMGVSSPRTQPGGGPQAASSGRARPGIPTTAPGGRAAHSPSSLGEVLRAPAGLERTRRLVNWLQRIDGHNWMEHWKVFLEAVQGCEVAHVDELQQVLQRIGEVAGQAGVAYFAGLEIKADTPVNTATVLAAWAASDPAAARKYLDQGPFRDTHSGSFTQALQPALIQGVGRHGIGSLKEMAADMDARALRAFGPEVMEAARQRGSPRDGEEIWRNYRERMNAAGKSVSPAMDVMPPDRQVFSALLRWRVASDTAAGPQGAGETCAWLSSLAEEGYRVDEDSISFAVHFYGKADPARAFQWLIDIAGRTRPDPEQSRQLIQRQAAVVHEWAKADPEGLSRWLVAHPSQPGYEYGASALYHQLKNTDPAAAAAWAQAVTDPGLKQYIK